MKALTICQPFAELIARGEKLIENRTWPTPYRGLLIIHAGKSREWLDFSEIDEAESDRLPFGAIVATARLVDCQPVHRLSYEMQCNRHANGPWCWMLADVWRLPTPIPYRGAQGLFDIPSTVLAAAQAS